MKKISVLIAVALIPMTVNILLLCGCDTGSGDSTIRQVAININGYYTAPDEDDTIVSACSGSCPYYLNLIQDGDEIQAYDDHGLLYHGSIGSVDSEAKSCSFVISGKSVAGAEVTMTGTIQVDGNTATMEGTWIEPSLYGVIYAVGSVPNQPSNNVSVTATTTSLTSGDTSTLTASGGNGNYTWTKQNNSYGTLSSTTGSQVTYTAGNITNSVSQVITVSDSAGAGASVTIKQSE